MDDETNRTPKPRADTPARPFLRPATGRENTAPPGEQKRRLMVQPFAPPARSKVQTPAAAAATPPVAATPPSGEAAPPASALPTEPTPLLVDAISHESPPAMAPARDSGERRTDDGGDGALDIVIGESLLELTGEYQSRGWDTIQPREESDVEHPSDWGAKLDGKSGAPMPPEEDELAITSESGLDWESWEFGRDTSDFAAQGEGFVIHRHELPPEASDIGVGGSAFDRRDLHGAPTARPSGEREAMQASHEERVPDVDRRTEAPGVGAEAPTLAAAESADTSDTEATSEPLIVAEEVAREEHAEPAFTPPSLPSIEEFRDATEARTESGSASRAPEISPRELEAVKEVEPWAMPPEPEAVAPRAVRPDDVALALERVAERIRRGALVLPAEPVAASDEEALAAALAALVRSLER